MRRTGCVAILAASACGRIDFDPSRDASGLGDAVVHDASVPPDGATFGGFGNPIVLVGMPDADPQLRTDQLELIVATPSPNYDIQAVTRVTTEQSFGGVAPVPGLSSAVTDIDPSLSASGLVLIYSSDRSGPYRAYETRRLGLMSPFSAPAMVAGLESIEIRSLDLSADGLTIYFVADDEVLRRSRRPDLLAAFQTPEIIVAPPLSFPTVSSDELLLFGNVLGGGVLWATRSTPNEPFIGRGQLDIGSLCALNELADPDITADDKFLVVRCITSEILILSRP